MVIICGKGLWEYTLDQIHSAFVGGGGDGWGWEGKRC